MEEEVSVEYLLEQVMHNDVGKRLQVGQEVTELILDGEKSPELEQDQATLDRMVEAVAGSWVNSSNFKVRTGCWFKGGDACCWRRGGKNEHTPSLI
uniref:Uncharacterized protein n=2 Tax=Seriola lalandi dorsalis TaxID=1841481 RepID=A0A3B4XPT5_SERLL